MRVQAGVVVFVGCCTLMGQASAGSGSDSMRSLHQYVANDVACGSDGGPSFYYGGTSLQAEDSGANLIPMTRPLRQSVCDNYPNYRLNAIGLEALTIVQSRREGTLGATGSAYNAPALLTGRTCLGVKFVDGDSFSRIRALVAGGTGTAATATGRFEACMTPFRASTANNWQNFTASQCARSGNRVHHFFRPGDDTDMTEAFKLLTGVSGFCNGLNGQDNDPIRRPCLADEQVCGPDGTLGLVLPISVPLYDKYPGAANPPDTSAQRLLRWKEGQFYRLHQSKVPSRDPNTGQPVIPCRRPETSGQIGCLSAVSPYSAGLANLTATVVSGVVALKVGNVTPRPDTLRDLTYPFTRLLYYNALFDQSPVAGPFLNCVLNRAYMDPLLSLSAHNFVAFSDDPYDGAEVDYQDQTCIPDSALGL